MAFVDCTSNRLVEAESSFSLAVREWCILEVQKYKRRVWEEI